MWFVYRLLYLYLNMYIHLCVLSKYIYIYMYVYIYIVIHLYSLWRCYTGGGVRTTTHAFINLFCTGLHQSADTFTFREQSLPKFSARLHMRQKRLKDFFRGFELAQEESRAKLEVTGRK